MTENPSGEPGRSRPTEAGASRRATVTQLSDYAEARGRAARSRADQARRAVTGEPPHNLPLELTSFIGREREIGEVTRLLSEGRLVSLTGAPGVGKTRLARQVAADVLELYPHGVRLVELAPLVDPALVPHAVAAALAIREQPGRTVVETLTAALRATRLLLVLDNCEHVLAACAEVADGLLRGCPGLRILATSREPLGVAGEISWPVRSLSLPDLDGLNDGDTGVAAAVTHSEAAGLFLDRARSAQPTFTVTDQNGWALAEVCRRLDGIPLAIELAAARVSALTPQQIVARLDHRFRLLTGGAQLGLRRHQTLRAAVEWSYELLSEPERVVLRRLSIFAGGCTLEAAEAVCSDVPSQPTGTGGATDTSIAAGDVLDVLARLVARSLLVAEDRHGEMRYGLLETMREYGMERLREAGEEATLQARHCDWFVALAERAEPEFAGPNQQTWFRLLDAELENLRAALGWTVSQAPERGLRIASALLHFWETRGYLSEGSGWLKALSAKPPAESSSARGMALVAAAYLAYMQGLAPEFEEHTRAALDLARELGDPRVLGYALICEGGVLRFHGDLGGALARFEKVRVLAGQGGGEFIERIALYHMGELARLRGDYDGAAALFGENVDLCEARGDRLNKAYQVAGLAHVALLRGDLSEARERYRQALILWRDLEEARNLPWALEGLAWVASADGQAERAVRLMAAVDVLGESVGAPLLPQFRADRERAEEAARAALGQDAFAAGRAAGRAVPWDEAVAYALSSDAPSLRATRTPPGDRDASPLTRRQREVVALVARGFTNRQIAEELVITERTAESHVHHVLQKLGVGSRVQLAVWAIDHGLQAPAASH